MKRDVHSFFRSFVRSTYNWDGTEGLAAGVLHDGNQGRLFESWTWSLVRDKRTVSSHVMIGVGDCGIVIVGRNVDAKDAAVWQASLLKQVRVLLIVIIGVIEVLIGIGVCDFGGKVELEDNFRNVTMRIVERKVVRFGPWLDVDGSLDGHGGGIIVVIVGIASVSIGISVTTGRGKMMKRRIIVDAAHFLT